MAIGSLRRVSPAQTPYTWDERQLVRRQLDDEMAVADRAMAPGTTDPYSGRMRMPGEDASTQRRIAQLSMGPWAAFMDAQTDERRLAENRGLKFGGVKPAAGMGPTAGEAMPRYQERPAGRALRSLSGLDGPDADPMRPGLRSAIANKAGENLLDELERAPLRQWQATEARRQADFENYDVNREAAEERDMGRANWFRSEASRSAAQDKSRNYWQFEEPIEQHQFPMKEALATGPARIAYDRATEVERSRSATARAIAEGRQPSAEEFVSDLLQGVTSAYRDPRTGKVTLPPEIQALQERVTGRAGQMMDRGAGPRPSPQAPAPAAPAPGRGGQAPAGGPTAGTAEAMIQQGMAEGYSRQEVIDYLMKTGRLGAGGR